MSRGPAYIPGVYVHRTVIWSVCWAGAPAPSPSPKSAASALDVSAKPAVSSHLPKERRSLPRRCSALSLQRPHRSNPALTFCACFAIIFFFCISLATHATLFIGVLLFFGISAFLYSPSMAPLTEVGAFLGGLEGLGQQVGSHFLLPPAGERPPLLGERRGALERGARGGGPGSVELAHLHGILRRRQLYCRTGFHLQILPDGSVQGTRQDHSLFGRYKHPVLAPPTPLLFSPPSLQADGISLGC